ncbi:hypothetical protein Pelo_7892 [Pelomyxa schiedti]|nr:hypothetical protein Pelo_7892 [Pelomyxa schiedti]
MMIKTPRVGVRATSPETSLAPASGYSFAHKICASTGSSYHNIESARNKSTNSGALLSTILLIPLVLMDFYACDISSATFNLATDSLSWGEGIGATECVRVVNHLFLCQPQIFLQFELPHS